MALAMRARHSAPLLALAWIVSGAAWAETEVGSGRLSGELEFGGRLVWGDEGAAKFQEYRDLRDGVLGEFDLLLENEDSTRWLRARGENLGYDDQRYRLEGGRYGRWGVELFYGELPHVQSNSAQSFYQKTGRSSFDLIDGTTRVPAETELRWLEGKVGGFFQANEALRLRGDYRIQDKKGDRNFAIGFGTPGGNFIQLPGPVNEQIHEVTGGTDYVGERWNASLDYLGSFYRNELESITGQNPLVPADINGGAAFGRSSVAPDNWAQSVSLSGSGTLPIAMSNRITASFAYGLRRQNESFLPHTRNAAVVVPPGEDLALPQGDLDGWVQTLLGNLLVTLRPVEVLGLKFRYRLYDYDNQTDPIRFSSHVENDTVIVTGDRISVANDYRKQNADLDASLDLARHLTGTLGFGWEYWRRSRDREVENLHEYGPTLKLDYRNPRGLFVQGGYRFRHRQGSSYDPYSYLDESFVGLSPAQQSANVFRELRKYDQADRELHRVDLLARAMPADDLELTLTADLAYADYVDSDYGLTESLDWSVGTDARYQVHPRMSIGGYYTFQYQKYWQESRFRPRNVFGNITPVDDPDNDWRSRTRFEYHNVGFDVDLVLVPDRLDAELGYLFQYGAERTRARSVPGGSGNPGPGPIFPPSLGDAESYPTVRDRLHAIQGVLAWHLTESVTARAGYRYEDWAIEDFRDDLIPSTGIDGSGDLYLGDVLEDYRAHVFVLSAILRF